MTNLVPFINAIDSWEIAKMAEKEKKNLLANIREYIENMQNSIELKIQPSDFVIKSMENTITPNNLTTISTKYLGYGKTASLINVLTEDMQRSHIPQYIIIKQIYFIIAKTGIPVLPKDEIHVKPLSKQLTLSMIKEGGVEA